MKRRAFVNVFLLLVTATFWHVPTVGDGTAEAVYGWRGKRHISYQDPHDLFYNYYAGPMPSSATAQMYVSPLPVPANVGHTYNTYQPLYPHEFTYGHKRSWYTHNPGAGWTRTKAYYFAPGNLLQHTFYRLNY